MVRIVGLVLLFCCSEAQISSQLMTPQQFQALPTRPADERIAYGTHTDQFGELRVPAGSGPYPVVILIHGGCWRADFSNLHELGPIADALKAKGIATWNIEYRRLGQSGGGWPGTYLDVAHAVDHLRLIAARRKLDLNRVVVVGHSAGGHLAMWTAARRRVPRNSAIYVNDPLPIRGVIDLAGTADMKTFLPLQRSSCGGQPVVEEMLGGTPTDVPERYAAVSAIEMLPLGVMQTLVWGRPDQVAPISLAENYVAAAKRENETVNLITFEKIGHFEIATPFKPSWPLIEKQILTRLSKRHFRA
jgi:acetyl esterase/lipase